MLSIIHIINGEESKIVKKRRRLREINSNSQKVRSVFGSAARKSLPILKIIDDYNHHMGGVNIADQLHSYYST